MALLWPLPDRTDLRDRLLTAYSTGRGYHDLRHLTEVLDRLAELGSGDNLEVALAAWYHDAVYDDEGDNEERSARLAESDLEGDSRVDVEEVVRLVRLTRTHRPEPGDDNGAVLSDADLGILAAPRQRYEEYVADVRREYAAVPDRDFARGRLAVLEQLSAKPTLFHTERARVAWEAAARENLSREMAGLRALI